MIHDIALYKFNIHTFTAVVFEYELMFVGLDGENKLLFAVS